MSAAAPGNRGGFFYVLSRSALSRSVGGRGGLQAAQSDINGVNARWRVGFESIRVEFFMNLKQGCQLVGGFLPDFPLCEA